MLAILGLVYQNLQENSVFYDIKTLILVYIIARGNRKIFLNPTIIMDILKCIKLLLLFSLIICCQENHYMLIELFF